MENIPRTIDFCSVSELKKKKCVTKWVDEWRDELSALWVGNEIIILSTICPHFGGPMEFIPEQKKLKCKWHGWDFDVDSGKCRTFSISGCLRRYSFKELENRIEVSFS